MQPAHKPNFMDKFLDGVERLGNKVPHPAIIFLGLIAIVILLSEVLYWFDIDVTYEVVEPEPIVGETEYYGGSSVPEVTVPPAGAEEESYDVVTETIEVESLLRADGLRFIFTSAVTNFNNFGVVGVILVAMLGVGVAEEAGLMAALIRRMVAVTPAFAITFVVVLVGMLSSIASDAGYLVLIPLGGAAFLTLGRHPLAGVAAAFAGVAAGFMANIFITPADGIVVEVATESARIVDPTANIGILSNFYFGAASTFFVALVITVVTERLVEPRLGTFGGEVHDEDDVKQEVDAAAESRGLRYTLFSLIGVVAVLLLLTLPPNAVLRDPDTNDLIGDSPFMDSLLFLIAIVFLVIGVAYGVGAGTIKSSVDVINAIQKTFAGLAGLIFILLIIAQFIAYFNFSNIPRVTAVNLADWLESVDVDAIWLLLAFIFVTALLDFIIPGVIPKWAIFAPIFVPLFIELGVAPQTVLAAYRVGDGPTNVVTPLMVYLPFIVIVAQRYKQDAGIGTIVSLMLPYFAIVLITWTLFFVAWYLLEIPLGPGYPVKD